MTFQNLILKLSEFWASRGCTIQQPLDTEVGAGTMHPETFLRVLGPGHWNVAYVQPSRHRVGADFRRVDLRSRADRDGVAARRQHVRSRMVRRRQVPGRETA